MQRVAVLVSGGVDSSVALMRLVADRRYEVTAFYLKIWLEDELAFLGACPWEDDLTHVRAVCDLAGVPLEIVPLQREYRELVVEASLAELRSGRTPSPDVLCNRHIKFGAFGDRVGHDFDWIASGHYARTQTRDGLARLLRGVDPVKDQTYFLCRMTQRQISRALFPIGDLVKSEVRDEARRLGLPNSDRPDSQGICFLGQIPYDDFILFHLGERPGEIRDLDSGRVLGHHRGSWFHTIGQRRGLGLGGGPWYVCRKDLEQNVVWVTHRDHLTDHARRILELRDLRWIARPPSSGRLEIRLRHGQTPIGCSATVDGDRVQVRMDELDPGIAPGQVAVLSRGDEVLGGGIIAEVGEPRTGLG